MVVLAARRTMAHFQSSFLVGASSFAYFSVGTEKYGLASSSEEVEMIIHKIKIHHRSPLNRHGGYFSSV